MLLHRQKQRENKKFSKAVQAERQKEKVQQKKANISDITKLRKQRQKQARHNKLTRTMLHQRNSMVADCIASALHHIAGHSATFRISFSWEGLVREAPLLVTNPLSVWSHLNLSSA